MPLHSTSGPSSVLFPMPGCVFSSHAHGLPLIFSWIRRGVGAPVSGPLPAWAFTDLEPQTPSPSLSPAVPPLTAHDLYLHRLIVADEACIGEDLVDGDGVDRLIPCEGEGDVRGRAGTMPAVRVTGSGRQPGGGQAHSYWSCESVALWPFWARGGHHPAELSLATAQAWGWEGWEGQVAERHTP